MIFRRVPPPSVAALETLVRVISERVGRALERQGLLVRDLANSFLTVDSPDGAGFDDLLGHSITYRIALGPHQGRKAFTVQTVPTLRILTRYHGGINRDWHAESPMAGAGDAGQTRPA